jgi:nucleotide-binding universal stress UspA family protein
MRILLAVDGSIPADQAVDLLATFPWTGDDRLRILSVAPSQGDVLGVPWGKPPPTDAPEIEDAVLRVHRDAIERAEAGIRSTRAGLSIEPVLARGRAASVIVDQAGEFGADLVVVGHRGLGVWESRLLGSVSAEVVDHAPCPVLVVRDDRIGPVVLADDGSPDARAAAQLIADWSLFHGVPVTVVGVVDDGFPYAAAVAPPLYAETLERFADGVEAERRARSAACGSTAERLQEAGIAATVWIRTGDPAHEIVAAADGAGAGLVVVGTRGRTGLPRLILGSVARNVLLSAPCNVLVARVGVRAAGRHPADGGTVREVVSAFG